MSTSVCKNFVSTVIISCCLTLLSCNNGDKETPKEQKEQSAETNQENTSSKALTAGPFTVLKLDKQALIDLFNNTGANAKKILIQFSDDGSSQFMQAVAFGANKNNVYQNVLKTLTPASTNSWDTTGLKIMGNNELTKKQIKTLIGGTINATNAKDLYFYPIKNSNNQIYFIVSTSLVPFTTTGPKVMLTYPTGGEDSKPSPPAPPCAVCE
ncbi:MAG: hypothetical protein IPP02_01250 [Chitinophagaceae bacterium]|jgi:hypothetical protein|nr:hypothetical protein [Chitinophagaceae bacterium]MBK7679277.1 hypothetical protein [Chitinophagaceae bacterium]MBK8299379.1 hypothetical protein [Chitinophagaceae bacterium]MBK9463428.1 hypothetical protein [Chitinophagaceae bacterium]MBK9659449.1 hypothetical protein [Chitinophagaceae bacterium]